MLLRDARPHDAAAIAGVIVAAALHAFEDLLDPRELMQLADLERETGEWDVRLADPNDHLVLVVEHGGRVIGVAAWLVPRGPRLLPVQDGILTHLYVHPAVQGAGVGSRLLAEAEDRLRAIGGETAQLSLHEDNPWTAALLARHGWAEDLDRPADAGPNVRWTRTF